MGWPYAIEASSYAGDQHRPDHSPLRMQRSPSSPGSGRAFFTARIRMNVPHLPIGKARRRERSAECR